MAADNADRNLLFGLLALQNGIINHSQLRGAFQAWTLDRFRSLADHLSDRGDLDDDCSAIEALTARHLKRHGGEVKQSLAAVNASRSTRESLAQLADADIESSLAHLGATLSQSVDDADRTASYGVGTGTSNGQRFRILRPHARGGLGAVFVALDSELHREVALMQILDQHADDPTSRRRFLIEAEITGGLEHPGIVPVYGLGTYGDGRPYYAMRFVKGDSLKEAIERFHADAALHADPGLRSLALRKLLRRFLDVCNALDYAHSRGVIHRDIKPANVIVGKYGETLVVDWGLAKALGRAGPGSDERTLLPGSASGSSETLPGSALGTPAYMSPEQAAGDIDRLGAQSDVYSLGATLYCLLTGRPPYKGNEVGAILRAVQSGEFRPPCAIDPSIDPALEAVCKKAMALEPEDRYGSPRALVDDVERWMADEPVTAWREPLARRWARRNRTPVTAAAVALLAGVVGLSAVLVVEARANVALADANTKVQARYDLAMDAIKTFHTGVSEDFLLREEKFKDLRNRLLNSALDFYSKLGSLLATETDATSRRALFQANFEAADLTGKVGRKEDALAGHRSVLAARESLALKPRAGAKAQVEVGRSILAVAGLLRAMGQTAAALAAYRQGESLLAGLAGAEPEARAALAACRYGQGWILASTGQTTEALAAYRLARSEQEALAALSPASNASRRDLADTINRIGILLSQTGRPAEAEAEYREALVIRQTLADENSSVTDFRTSLADSHYNLGLLLSNTARPAEAEAEYLKALAIRQELVDDHPAVTDFRNRLALSHNGLGILLSNTGRSADAEAEYRQAVEVQQKLADDNPAVTEFRGRLADSHNNLGLLLSDTGQRPEAEAEHRMALAIRQKLADDHPTVSEYRRGVTYSLINVGDLLTGSGHGTEAIDCFARSREILEALVQENPSVEENRNLLAFSLSRLGSARRRAGDHRGAAADLRRAIALWEGLAAISLEARYDLARNHALLAVLVAEGGSGLSPAEGRAYSEQAVEVIKRLVAEGYRNPNSSIEPDFASLRRRPDFQLLLLDLAFPTEPIAR
jgi:eukaryotic-like serine/threonine-protein kinase